MTDPINNIWVYLDPDSMDDLTDDPAVLVTYEPNLEETSMSLTGCDRLFFI
jgi:hypothetical protein